MVLFACLLYIKFIYNKYIIANAVFYYHTNIQIDDVQNNKGHIGFGLRYLQRIIQSHFSNDGKNRRHFKLLNEL